jgi:hypothetical protein
MDLEPLSLLHRHLHLHLHLHRHDVIAICGVLSFKPASIIPICGVLSFKTASHYQYTESRDYDVRCRLGLGLGLVCTTLGQSGQKYDKLKWPRHIIIIFLATLANHGLGPPLFTASASASASITAICGVLSFKPAYVIPICGVVR